jgi:N-hydroxyarylamine O-acetyltransferase
LADVGWGDTFRQPLQLDTEALKHEGSRAYRLERHAQYLVLWKRDRDGTWKADYRFTLCPRQYSDFAGMCDYHQTSPNSPFTQKRLCTMATGMGRITLEQMRLITTVDGQRHERSLSSEMEFRSVLQRQFGIDLGNGEGKGP